jgi:DNA polymerase V
MPDAIALVDANSFYASVQTAWDAKLTGRAVIVLSNNDACVVARNDLAKKLGIQMSAPVFEIRDLIEQNGVVALSSNYELYGDVSARIMDVLADFTPEMEVYSIDEAWLRFPAIKGETFSVLGREIRRRVRQYTGIPVSVGFGSSKTLAKVANYYAKTAPKCRGVLDLVNSPHLV